VANATNGNSDEQRHGPSTNSSAHDKSSATIPDAERTPGQQHLDEVGQKGRDMFKTGEKVMTEGAKEGAIILATDGLGRIATKAAGPLATNVGRLWDKVVKFFRGESKVAGAADAAGASVGSLVVETGGIFSQSEVDAAKYVAALGKNVILRMPKGTRAGGGTSDLLVDGARYDVFTPVTTNVNRIISAMAKKNSQAEGVVLDLSKTSVNASQLSNALSRVNGAGATNIRDIIIMGK
jgi:hypothetical protein